MFKTNLKIIFIFAAVFISAVFIFNGFNFRDGINKTDVKAAATDNIAGYAWSESIGWVSFNCTNATPPCSGTNYGVKLNVDNTLSGYAFSESIGWISFNAADVAGCPAGGTCQPRYNSGTGEFLGWARALNNGGGWDGWISLNCANSGGATCTNSNYKVSKSGSDFTGFAWGGDVVGWISFNSKNCDLDNNNFIDSGACGGNNTTTPVINYKVSLTNTPPTAINLSATQPDYCSSGPAETLSWTFSDPDAGSSQTAYQVQIATDAGFTAIIKDSCVPASGSCAFGNSSPSYTTPASTLVYNQTYYWRVMVWDNNNTPSVWANGTNFSTPAHAYPTANFTYLPASPEVSQTITFTDASTAFGGATITNRDWDFENDGINDSSGTPVTHTYGPPPQIHSVKLTVKDSNTFQCFTVKSLNVNVAPKWKEVIPK